MELSLTDRLRRTEQPVRTERKKSESVTEASSPRELLYSDQVSLSKQAAAYVEAQNRQRTERAGAWAIVDQAMEELEAEEDKLDAILGALDAMRKCHEIAARIMRGDKVPPEDERYLMENDPDGYKLALVMRRPKKDPKEWESILGDEDKNGGSDEGEAESAEGAGEAPASGEASSGGNTGGEAGGGE